MSYDPSHRMPPRQERWPHATPAEGWPSYRDPEEQEADRLDASPATAGYRRQAGYQHASGGSGDRGHQSAVATATFPAAGNGYGTTDGYGSAGYGGVGNGYTGASNGYTGASNGYTGTIDGYAGAADGFHGVTDGFDGAVDGYTRTDGGYGRAAEEYAGDVNDYDWNANGYAGTAGDYAGAPDDFAGTQDGFAGGAYLGPGSYTEPGLADPMFSSDPMLTAPDAGVHPESWQVDQERRREASRRGLMVGAVTELIATGVVIGVSTLAAALLRSQTSPVSALGTVFIDRIPAALRNVALQHFGTHGGTVLLLGMYAVFAVVAIVIGGLARRAAALGVAGIAAFTLFAAFAAITRPAGHVGDVTPAVVGGIAGVAALLWLFRASAPIAPLRHTGAGTRRRAR